jgi:hypothetical protein
MLWVRKNQEDNSFFFLFWIQSTVTTVTTSSLLFFLVLPHSLPPHVIPFALFMITDQYFHLMQEYISDSHFPYSECLDCTKRSAHVCIRCHYCYSCHPKIEQLEKRKIHAQVNYEIPKQQHFIKYKRNPGKSTASSPYTYYSF